MKTTSVKLSLAIGLAALSLMLWISSVRAATFTSNTAISVGDTTYDGQDIVVNACTLTVNGPHSFNSLLVTNGGVITHSPAPNGEANNRLDLTIAQDVTIDPSSSMNVSSGGYAPERGPGAGANGWSGTGGAGGGHGGKGGTGNGPAGGGVYGSIVEPTDLGSGGGIRPNYSDGTAGPGGGALRLLVAGTLHVGGTITANGSGPAASWHIGGGGAGGSVFLTAGVFTGNGSITANGGNTTGSGGAGGGGRISIYSATNTFTGTIAARGGASGSAQFGGAGTIYLKPSDALGQVIVDNGGNSGAQTRLNTSQWPAGLVFDLTVQRAAAVYPDMPLAFNNLRVTSGGWMSHDAGQNTLQLTILGDVEVGTNSAITANGCGYAPERGPGAGANGWSGTGGAGGGYGGKGGTGNGPAGGGVYGSVVEPTDLGSGGGIRPNYSDGTAGPGGGVLRLVVAGTLRVDGAITANGSGPAAAWHIGGAGAGGSVFLTAGVLTGNGSITCNGGNTTGSGGAGGGGRIAIYSTTNAFTGTITARGGASGSAQSGGAGTIFLKRGDAPGEVIIDNGGQSGAITELRAAYWPSEHIFGLTVSGNALVHPIYGVTFFSLTMTNSGRLSHVSLQNAFDVTVLGDGMIDASSRIDVTGQGYRQTEGLGAGASGFAGAGGGYGGAGGPARDWCGGCPDFPGGRPYGSATSPVDFGSGGGIKPNYSDGNGSPGGGAVRLTFGGALRLDGTIAANGSAPVPTWHYGGAGAGGSIFLTVGSLSGSGWITASGGNTYCCGSGAGGGGRVAIYGDSVGFPNVQVAGGVGSYGNGLPGTIFRSSSMPLPALESHAPAGLGYEPVDHVDVVFNTAIRAGTLTVDDAVVTTPTGALAQAQITVSALAARLCRISFPRQLTPGSYQVQIGPNIENLFGNSMAEIYIGIFTITNPAISGTVRLVNGPPLADVTLRAETDASAVTGTNGQFTLVLPPGWSGTVTPEKSGFAFTPTSRAYVNVTANLTNQDFTALVPTIAGTVVLTNGLPVPLVTLQADNGGFVATSDFFGNYTFQMPPGWSGAITPRNPGCAFAPPSRTYTNLVTIEGNQDFTMSVASAPALSVSRQGARLRLEWPTLGGFQHWLQVSEDLRTWTNYAGPYLGDGRVIVLDFDTGSRPHLFFRLRINFPWGTCIAPPAGLVGWWPGQGNANDRASGNNGAPQNGAGFAPGLVGQAFQLDGLDDAVLFPNTRLGVLDITNQALTVAAWINLATTNHPFGLGHVIFGKYWTTSADGYQLQIFNGQLRFDLATTGQPDFYLTASPVLPTNQWLFVAGTYDGSFARLYVNGVETASAPLTGSILHNDYDAALGNDNGLSTQYGFNGLIDEVAVFNRALAANEVAALYTAGSAGMCAPSSSAFSPTPDFTITQGNPNGVWSYGWMPTDFSSFNLYVNHAPEYPQWYGWGSDWTPTIWKNLGSPAYGVPTGWLSLHPGPGTEPCVLRWTAPVSGSVRVTGRFLPGDGGQMQVAVRRNGQPWWAATDAGEFDLTTDILAGGAIDFAVFGGYYSGNTPLQVTITRVP